MWDQPNRRNWPSLKYKPTTVAGLLVPPPQRSQLDQTGMSLAMLGMQEAAKWVQGTTFVYDQSLGRGGRQQDESGKKVLALQRRSGAATSHFLASMAEVSMPLEARIVLDLMPAICDRPGRLTTILRGDDDKSEFVMLGAPYYTDPQTSRPVPVQPGQQPPQMGAPPMGANGSPLPGMPMGGPQRPPQAMGPGGPQQQPKIKEYNLKKGAYSVSVSIGKSFQTRLQQGADEMGQILSAQPE